MASDLGNRHARQDLRRLLEEFKKENIFFRQQLAASVEHNAHLEARLLSTLDTLDQLRASTAREFEQAQRENARLVEKLNACQTIAREADKEKFEMSNVVLQLVEKVEACNDYSEWPASRIEFSQDIVLHPVRSSSSSQPGPSHKDAAECRCALAYSVSVVEELAESLVKEKRAHALMVEEAERRDAVLRARIAERDAEIARLVATFRPLPSSSSVHLNLMSEEERARITARTIERNKLLSSEVTMLRNKLESQRSSSRHLVDQCIQTEASGSPRLPRLSLAQEPAFIPSTRNDYDAVPAALTVIDSQIAQLRGRLTDLVAEKEALHSVLRNELDVQDSDDLVSPHKHRRSVLSKPVQGPAEHEGNLSASQDAGDSRNMDGVNDIFLLEEECIRLMHSEDSLRNSLDKLQEQCALLNEENARLKAEISTLRCAQTSDRPSLLSLPPLDTSAIDRAFPPLQPDAISPTYGDNCDTKMRTSPVPSRGRGQLDSSGSSASSSGSPVTPTSILEPEPSDIPLPRTPTSDDAEHDLEIGDRNSMQNEVEDQELPVSPLGPEHAPPSLPDVSSNPAGVRDEQTVGRELADARVDAEMREREIAEVRDLMADLAMRIDSELQGSGI